MSTRNTSITLAEILNDTLLSTNANAGDQVKYALGQDAQTAGYSFQEANPGLAIDSIVSLTPGISDQQAKAFIDSTTPAITGNVDQFLTLTIASNALVCSIKFNIRIKKPGNGGYLEFDPIIVIMPR